MDPSSTSATDEYSIEQITFDEKTLPEITKLVDAAFNIQTRGGTISFDRQTINLMFGSPFTPRDLFSWVRYIPTGEIVGFIGGIPRTIAYKGKNYRFGIPSWQSVPYPQHQRKGLATRMGVKMMEIGKQKGFEGGFAIFEPEEFGITTGRRISQDNNIPVKEILEIKQFVVRSWEVDRLAKIIDLKPIERIGMKLLEKISTVNNPRVRIARVEDHEQIFQMMHDFVKRNELSVVREHDDFHWFLQQPGVLTIVHENEDHKVDGFILAWKMNLAGYGHMEPYGWLDAVHIYNLNLKEATDLCKFFCVAAKDAGWSGIQTPFIPYFDPRPFKKAKFIFYPKTLLVHLFQLKPLDLPEKVKSFYFDWR